MGSAEPRSCSIGVSAAAKSLARMVRSVLTTTALATAAVDDQHHSNWIGELGSESLVGSALENGKKCNIDRIPADEMTAVRLLADTFSDRLGGWLHAPLLLCSPTFLCSCLAASLPLPHSLASLEPWLTCRLPDVIHRGADT